MRRITLDQMNALYEEIKATPLSPEDIFATPAEEEEAETEAPSPADVAQLAYSAAALHAMAAGVGSLVDYFLETGLPHAARIRAVSVLYKRFVQTAITKQQYAFGDTEIMPMRKIALVEQIVSYVAALPRSQAEAATDAIQILEHIAQNERDPFVRKEGAQILWQNRLRLLPVAADLWTRMAGDTNKKRRVGYVQMVWLQGLRRQTQGAPAPEKTTHRDESGLRYDIGANLTFVEITCPNVNSDSEGAIVQLDILRADTGESLFTARKPLVINTALHEGSVIWMQNELPRPADLPTDKVEVRAMTEGINGNAD